MVARPRIMAGIPLLVAEPRRPAGSVPVVFWFHGFRADALAHAGELERCAATGFLAVGVDAVDHGARAHPDLSSRVAGSPGGALSVMLELVEAGVRELPSLIDALADHYPIDRARISAVGISMGAFQVYAAIAASVPLRAVVALLGSPEWPATSSPHRSLHAFGSVALLSITAEHDASVPPEPVRRLHAAIDGAAMAPPDRHHHHVLRGAGHLTTAAEWAEAMQRTMAWLHRMG